MDRIELFPHDRHSNTRPFCFGNSCCVISSRRVKPQRVHVNFVEGCLGFEFDRLGCLETLDKCFGRFILSRIQWMSRFSK